MAALVLLVVLVASYPAWKTMAKRNRAFVIASNLALDSLRRFGLKSGQIGQDAVIAPPESQIPQDLAKVQSIYAVYLQYAGISRSAVPGKRMLELGPGFTMGVPLLFAADGAERVAGLDKFVPFQDGPYYRHFYARLRESLDASQRSRFDRAIGLDKVALNPAVATYIYRKDLTDSVNDLGPGSYDLIVSNAVIEEIYDPAPVFAAQDQLLRSGGTMVHKIDLRDYGMFSKYGFHPLEFLTVSDGIYRRMVEASGQPDRRLIDYYRDLAVRMGYQSEIYITHVLGSSEPLPEPKRQLQKDVDYSDASLKLIEEIRPRLQPQFRKLPDADLLVQSIIFVAHKPGAAR